MDLQREQLKEKIDKMYEDIVQKIETFNQECKKNLSTIEPVDMQEYRNMVSVSKASLRVKDPDHFQLNQLSNNLNKLITESKDKLKLIESKVLMNKKVEFHPTISKFYSNDFGIFLNESKVEPIELLEIKCNSNVVSLEYLTEDQLISGHDDGKLNIWDLKSSECLKKLNGHKGSINHLLLLSNRKLASASSDNTIKIWNLDTNECINTLRQHSPVSRLIESLSGYLINGCSDSLISVWNLNDVECVQTMEEHCGAINDLKISKYGELLSASDDTLIKVWRMDYDDFEVISTLTGHTGAVNCLEVLSNSNLVSGSYDETVRIWDMNNYVCLNTIGFSDRVFNIRLISANYAIIEFSIESKLIDLDEISSCWKTSNIGDRLIILPNRNFASKRGVIIKVFKNNLIEFF